jgi:hypothetical protein
MFSCCVCSGPCDGLLSLSEESYQVCMSINLKIRGDLRRIWALQEGSMTDLDAAKKQYLPLARMEYQSHNPFLETVLRYSDALLPVSFAHAYG